MSTLTTGNLPLSHARCSAVYPCNETSLPGQQARVQPTYSSRWLTSTKGSSAKSRVISFASPSMAQRCNTYPPVSSPGAAMALTDPPIPPLPAVDENDTLIPKSSSHTSPSSHGPTAAPGSHPSSRAISRYLVSASAPRLTYFFPTSLHASHLARPAKSNSDGRAFSGAGATVRYLYSPYSCPRSSGACHR